MMSHMHLIKREHDEAMAAFDRLVQAGKVRYIGITHYTSAALDDLARIIEREPIDFVQFAYSIAARDAERRLLPLCAERGVATMRGFRLSDDDIERRWLISTLICLGEVRAEDYRAEFGGALRERFAAELERRVDLKPRARRIDVGLARILEQKV